LAHFDNPTQALQPGEYGRFTVSNPSLKQDGIAPGDKVFQGQLEQGNGNPVEQMADMIQAMRLYEANQKVVQAGDDNQGQLISTLGGK
jgi:flagellar basal-body rod protein FlgG